jgi:hypothetical protein
MISRVKQRSTRCWHRDKDQIDTYAHFKKSAGEFQKCGSDPQFMRDAGRPIQFDSPLVLSDQSRLVVVNTMVRGEDHTRSHHLHAQLNYVAVQRKPSCARNRTARSEWKSDGYRMEPNDSSLFLNQ